MKFSDFFEGWLNESYYANAAKIGKSGDFYTAVSVGSFFGICIAREILRLSADFCEVRGDKLERIAAKFCG